jgi:predicted Zn-dependent protease
MIGQEKLFARFEKALTRSKGDAAEILYIGEDKGLTRYANSAIHQNVYENNTRVFARLAVGKKVGVACGNSLVPGDLTRVLDDAYEIARNQPDNPHFPGLPKPAAYRNVDSFDNRTARFSPADRARAIRKIIKLSDRRGFAVAGAFATGCGEIAVLNTNGVRAYQPHSAAGINIVAMSDTSSGYAAGLSRHVDDIDFDLLARRAVDKCDLGQHPRSIEPGDYEVLLEPAAVAALLEWLTYIGFGAKAFREKTSFLSGKIGRNIVSPLITVSDDAFDSNAMAFPFDMEGVPKKKVMLIDKGVAKGVVYDSAYAAKDRRQSTGHAFLPDETADGPLPLNVVMAAGRTPRGKMIGNIKRGILVTRFHYINGFIDTPRAVLTGMTRDGAFLVENGEIAGGVKNLRFTDSMTRVFGATVAVSRERELVESWWSSVGCIRAPAVHLGSFRFTGTTG